jgi:hypothetical protein
MRTSSGKPNWDWRAGFEDTSTLLGFLFERWYGGLLRALGVTNVVSGLVVRGSGDKVAANESDFLAIHNGKFFCIELKLRDDQISRRDPDKKLIEILRKSSDLARNFAGNGGIPLVLIPNWQLTDGQQNLCQLFSPTPRVLDAKQSSRLIPWTAEQLGIEKLPPEIDQLNQEILKWMSENQLSRIFGPEAPVRHAGREDNLATILSFSELMATYRRESGQNWLLWEYEQKIRLRIPRMPNQTEPPGFRPLGQESWEATYACTNTKDLKEIKQKIQNKFGRFALQAPNNQHLIQAWQKVVGQPHPPQLAPARATPVAAPPAPPKLGRPATDIRSGTWRRVLEGEKWWLEKRSNDGRFRLTAAIGKNGKLGGLSMNDFKDAV